MVQALFRELVLRVQSRTRISRKTKANSYRVVLAEYLIIATKDMILTQLPIDLDVEFEMITRKGPRSAPKPPISPRSPTGGAAREAFWHEQMNDDEETYVSSWSEADDDDSIYQSVADYQDMQTIGGKGAARVGKFSSYATVDLTGMSTADKKLQVAQENLQKTRVSCVLSLHLT